MKVYSPVVLDSLGECLRTIYWYKKDLRSFLVRAGIPQEFVSSLDWSGYKRHIVKELLDSLATQPGGKALLDRLIGSVVEQDERFLHLQKLDDGDRKVADAQQAIRALKDLLDSKSIVEKAEQARQEKRTEAQREIAQRKERQRSLQNLCARFKELFSMPDHRTRGIEFESLLRDLFVLHDLDPRGGFTSPGEQTDGSIRLEGTVLLIEAKWTEKPVDPAQVRNFRTKVHDKLDSTLGLMISMAGFTDQAVETASGGGRMLVILMDGQELVRILEGFDDLVEVLQRKLRHAAESGRAMYRVGELDN